MLKLANLARNRVKLSEFTSRDKCNLLDLFVNNEKTLLKIYEALFPHRAAQQNVTANNSLNQSQIQPNQGLLGNAKQISSMNNSFLNNKGGSRGSQGYT